LQTEQARGFRKDAVVGLARFESSTCRAQTLSVLRQDRRRREQDRRRREAVPGRVGTLRGNDPWAGYDGLTASEVRAVLSEGDDDRAERVRSYERTHKKRVGVLKAATREHANASGHAKTRAVRRQGRRRRAAARGGSILSASAAERGFRGRAARQTMIPSPGATITVAIAGRR
jgi:hypothetical protein